MTTASIDARETRQIMSYAIVAIVGLIAGLVLGAAFVDQLRPAPDHSPLTPSNHALQKAD